jgi:hypothetical protein
LNQSRGLSCTFIWVSSFFKLRPKCHDQKRK